MTVSNDDRINRYIGGGLSLARIVRGLSIAELATAARIEPRRLSRLERGEAECTARELYVLADILGLPVDYFFEGVTADVDLPASDDTSARPNIVTMA